MTTEQKRAYIRGTIESISIPSAGKHTLSRTWKLADVPGELQRERPQSVSDKTSRGWPYTGIQSGLTGRLIERAGYRKTAQRRRHCRVRKGSGGVRWVYRTSPARGTDGWRAVGTRTHLQEGRRAGARALEGYGGRGASAPEPTGGAAARHERRHARTATTRRHRSAPTPATPTHPSPSDLSQTRLSPPAT